ncbi:MAG: DsbA family protein [Rhodospirillales bacterium]
MDKTLLYFADPMCSWCWGFSPVMEKILSKTGDKAQLQIFVGGLRPFTDHVMTDKDKSYVRNHWDHVAEASGQPFDFDFFERSDFTYDTEPACRAVVAVRRLDPDLAPAMLARLHRAFYAENRDTTDPEVLADLAHEVGVPRGDFLIAFADEVSKQETLADFQYAQRSQITGFPTLVGVQKDQTPVALTIGFRPWENMEPALEQWLAA